MLGKTEEKNPAISVIIPCYNHGEFLNEAVESVLAQTFRNYEIILVDDGSTDAETLQIFDSLKIKYPQIRTIHQPNGGPSNARNNGIRASRGEYFLPLDSDDTIDPRMLEKCLTVMSVDSKLGFAYTYTHFFGAVDFIWKNPGYNFYDLLWANQSTVCALVRKKAWEEAGGYDESKQNGYEDWEFWINLGKKGWYGKLIKEPLFNYRKKGESRVSKSELKHSGAVRYIRQKHSGLYKKDFLRQLKKKWKPWSKKQLWLNIDSKLEGAGLYDRSLWKKKPVTALGRLIPVRFKRKINSFFGKRIFNTNYYHRPGE